MLLTVGYQNSVGHLIHVQMQAPKVVIGPGTGLGQANILWDKSEEQYRVWPSGVAQAFAQAKVQMIC